MPDVHIDLIGRNRVGNAARGAANDLDKLAAKLDKFNRLASKLESKTAEVKIKADIDRSEIGRFRTFGRRLGGVFSQAIGNAISDGSRAIGNALRAILLKSPALQGVAVAAGVRLAALIGQGITAGFALLGPALLAGPVAFLLAKQGKSIKEADKHAKRVQALRKQLAAAEARDERARSRKGDSKAARAERKARIDDLYKELAAETSIVRKERERAASLLTLKERAKSFMQFISKPVEVPLAKSLDVVGKGLERLKGPVREIMANLAPQLPGFTKGIMDAFLNFINALKPALPGIVAGMRAWGQELPKIGTALGDMVADILKNPGAVVAAVRSVSGVIQDFATGAGRIVHGLTLLGQAFVFLETNINALEAGNLGATTGFFRAIAREVAEMAVAITGHVSKALTAMALLNPSYIGAALAAKKMHEETKAQLAGLVADWARTDAEIAAREIKAKITANIADLETKLAIAKQKLKDPNLSKAKKVQIQADITDLRLKIAIAKAQKVALAKKPSISKLQATMKDLQAKVSASKKSLDTVKNKETRAEIRANIKQAEAQIAAIKAELNALNGKTATTYIKTVTTAVRRGTYKPGGPSKQASDAGWQGALAGGGSSRTEPPTVNVAAPEVSTRIFIDGREIRTVARSTVLDENRRTAYRARVGRR
jgi:predicted phage tail protein